MSVNVEKRIDGPGESDHLDRAWELKERIRREENVLKQRKHFFTSAYRRATCHLYFEDEELVGFASVRRDGYILFLAVAPEVRGRGYGSRLVSDVAENHNTVTCHARTTNQNAIDFYHHLGFETERHIRNYYEDGGDAYYLKLGDAGLTEKISNLMRR